MRKVYVESEDGKTSKEYSIPARRAHQRSGRRHVKAGEALIDGPLNLHDLLAVLGEKFTQSYLVNAIQRFTASRASTSTTSTSRRFPVK